MEGRDGGAGGNGWGSGDGRDILGRCIFSNERVLSQHSQEKAMGKVAGV